VACDDRRYTALAKSGVSYFKYNTLATTDALTEATVEFWFKRAAESTTNST